MLADLFREQPVTDSTQSKPKFKKNPSFAITWKTATKN
jgi:hypothetical protein